MNPHILATRRSAHTQQQQPLSLSLQCSGGCRKVFPRKATRFHFRSNSRETRSKAPGKFPRRQLAGAASRRAGALTASPNRFRSEKGTDTGATGKAGPAALLHPRQGRGKPAENEHEHGKTETPFGYVVFQARSRRGTGGSRVTAAGRAPATAVPPQRHPPGPCPPPAAGPGAHRCCVRARPGPLCGRQRRGQLGGWACRGAGARKTSLEPGGVGKGRGRGVKRERYGAHSDGTRGSSLSWKRVGLNWI